MTRLTDDQLDALRRTVTDDDADGPQWVYDLLDTVDALRAERDALLGLAGEERSIANGVLALSEGYAAAVARAEQAEQERELYRSVAERDALKKWNHGLERWKVRADAQLESIAAAVERAERAEAERDDFKAAVHNCLMESDGLRARIAAALALCDSFDTDGEFGQRYAADVRRALSGEDQ